MTLAVLEAALRSSALLVAVWLLLRALRIRHPGVERTAWLFVLAASIVMPFGMQLAVLPQLVAPIIDLPTATIGGMTILDAAFEWQRLLLCLYLATAGALCLRQAIGLARLWRVKARAQPLASSGRIDVRTSSAVGAPATVFSTILVPVDFETWSNEEREAALAHEQAHLRNGDFYVQALAHLHRHLFWFNPLAWWLPKRLSLLSEFVSDEAAVAIQERTAYAQLLLRCARRTTGDEQAIAMARAAALATRVEHILDPAAGGNRPARWKHAAMAAVLLPVVAVSATLQTKQALPDANAAAATAIASDNVTLPKSNRARPLSHPVYPPASRRLGETGTVVLKLHVLEDGSVGDALIRKSSGHPDLDYAAMYESFRWQLDPGTVDGQPMRMWGEFAVTFKLTP
ncbi:MAG TPA: M56 family metallopeptidase [Povalibacter sp.]|uniref:M56 family metallopeptidase n=1 Tax=Povalibacter sp. TaxID=1962978 RepID=UPI002BCF8AEB|nr:M56 family metallopeptidase [Povalibacter sp.]HMN45108.1 M56 family metallopeptidase [Povalibacter sp.]